MSKNNNQEKVVTTINIDKNLHRRMKIYSALKSQSVAAITQIALREYLDRELKHFQLNERALP